MNLKVTPEDAGQLVLRTRASDMGKAMAAAISVWEDPPDGYKVTDVRAKARTGSGKRANLSIWLRQMAPKACDLLEEGSPAWKALELRLELLGVRT